MPKNAKIIKKRIGSVKNTRKITRSMQMIAASKMQKAVKAAQASRDYSRLSYALLQKLGQVSYEHELLKVRPVQRELVVVMSSNRGLCGGFNTNVLNAAKRYIKERSTDADTQISLVAVGRKSAILAKRLELELQGLYEQLGDIPNYDSALSLGASIKQTYQEEAVDKVTLVYTRFINSLQQTVEVLPLLPLDLGDALQIVSEVDAGNTNDEDAVNDYKLEPSADEVLDFLLPQLVDTQIYQSLLESAASEHSSRMIAMKSASDNAAQVIEILTLDYNKSRQAAITQEVAEITSGAEAQNDIN